MFNDDQKTLALNFAQQLAQRNYKVAYAMCSQNLQSQLTLDDLHEQFEDMIPLDWGRIEPIELDKNGDYPFVYVVLGGDVYSEAIFINSFVIENSSLNIESFEFGRP
ncbi:MAG: hypothetical protein GQ569_00580 [Methylococcaceae bacterium]|nr:hypothetical protein [Methylococcaceae bacterium]